MMLRFTCFTLLLSLTVGLELQAKLNSQWQKFKSVHGKSYSGAEEEKRKETFRNNVQAILQHNLEADISHVTYTLGVNEYSDMDHDEFVRTMLGASIHPENITARGNEVMVPTAGFKAPASLDWRQSGLVTPVKNQGSCGSCWTFSTAGTIEGAWAKSRKDLVSLSEQNILDCSSNSKYGNGGCKGGWPSSAMRYVIDNKGVNAASCYAYTGKVGSCNYKSTCKNVQISRYVDLPQGNENALLEAVANNGPISVCFDAGQNDFQNYRSGVYNPPYCSQTINHAVTLVGYGIENGLDYWLVKNSWGTSWGDAGYFKIARNKGNKCGIANGSAYAIV